jgi:hypothetical protein
MRVACGYVYAVVSMLVWTVQGRSMLDGKCAGAQSRSGPSVIIDLLRECFGPQSAVIIGTKRPVLNLHRRKVLSKFYSPNDIGKEKVDRTEKKRKYRCSQSM